MWVERHISKRQVLITFFFFLFNLTQPQLNTGRVVLMFTAYKDDMLWSVPWQRRASFIRWNCMRRQFCFSGSEVVVCYVWNAHISPWPKVDSLHRGRKENNNAWQSDWHVQVNKGKAWRKQVVTYGSGGSKKHTLTASSFIALRFDTKRRRNKFSFVFCFFFIEAPLIWFLTRWLQVWFCTL